MERRKIAFLDEGRGIGGAEKNLIVFLDHLNKNVFEPLVILSARKSFFTILDNTGIKIAVIKAPSFCSTSLEFGRVRILNPFAIVYDMLIVLIKSIKLYLCLSRNNISILQTNGMFEHIYGGIAAKLKDVTCIWYMQDIPRGFLYKFKALILNILAFILPTKVITASCGVKQVFHKSIKRKTKVIHNSIDISKYKEKSAKEIAQVKQKWNIHDAEYIVGMAGRLVHWKGHINFIKAAKIVSEKFPMAKFLIAGDIIFGKEKYRQDLKRLVRQLGLEEKVIFTGFIEDITEFLSILDIFVHCSLYPDPCPVAVMEACALKKAVVATAIGGIPEIIESGKEGVLVEPDNPQKLALEIISLINSLQQCELLGKRAYNKVRNKFDIRNQVRYFEEIYHLYK